MCIRERLRSYEEAEQAAIFEWAEYEKRKYPELELLYHVPNGGKRDAKTAAILKRCGVKAGVPDLVLPVALSLIHISMPLCLLQ